MRLRLGGVLAVIAACAAWSSAPRAAQAPAPAPASAPLPDAASLVAKHVAALGGAAPFKQVRSMHALGTIDIPAQHITGSMELFAARPARLHFVVNVAGIGKIENGFDGKVGWSLSLVTGPEVFAGKQLSEAADDAWFDGTLHEPDHVKSMTTIARTEFDKRPSYQVKVVLQSGNEQTEYFDVETGFQIGEEADRATAQGKIPTTNIMRDFKKFGAVMQPTTLVQRALGLEQVVTLASCEFNTVPDSAFELPASVKALVRP